LRAFTTKVRFEDFDLGPEDNEPFALDRLENHVVTAGLLEHALTAGDANTMPTIDSASRRLRQEGVLPAGGFGTLIIDSIGGDVQAILQRWNTAVARWPEQSLAQELRYQDGDLSVEGWLEDMRTGQDQAVVRLLPLAGRLLDKKDLRHHRLIHAWVMQLLANAHGIALTTHLFAADATVLLKPCARDDARSHLHHWLEAWREGMQKPLPVGCQTAFAWLIAQKAGKDTHHAARSAYEGSDVPQAPAGEMNIDPYLQRTWQSFAALYADGFEHWLSIYRPLLDAAVVEDRA
jgi:exodeoxyribonuclease V gamma subunit